MEVAGGGERCGGVDEFLRRLVVRNMMVVCFCCVHLKIVFRKQIDYHIMVPLTRLVMIIPTHECPTLIHTTSGC